MRYITCVMLYIFDAICLLRDEIGNISYRTRAQRAYIAQKLIFAYRICGANISQKNTAIAVLFYYSN